MGQFDSFPPRRGLSAKWDLYDADVLPLWIADMDFPAPEPVIEAMKARAASGQFGYEMDSPALREVVAARDRSGAERGQMRSVQLGIEPAHARG